MQYRDLGESGIKISAIGLGTWAIGGGPWWGRSDDAQNRIKIIELVKSWQPLAHKYSCTLAQLVIAWTIAQPGLTCALCGARREINIIENAGAGALQLESTDILRMRSDVEALPAPV